MASQLATSPTGSNQDISGGDTAWTNPTGVAASGGTTASAAMASFGSSQDLRGLFSFSIPASALPDGYVCEARVLVDSTPSSDGPIRLWQGGSAIGDDKDRGTTGWPTTLTYLSWGGTTDEWGTSLSAAQINSGTLGFSICADSQGFAAITAECDHMRMTVYYTDFGGGWTRWARGPLRGVLRGVFRRVRQVQGWFDVPPERRWLVQAQAGQWIGVA